jgi:hypothetical protein
MPALPRLKSLLAEGERLASDVVEAAVLLREVEDARFLEGTGPLVERLRARGKLEAPRSPFARRWLFRVVRRLDAFLLPEPNCYRRSLVHLALDPTSAAEPLVLGLDVRGGEALGHAWVAGTESVAKPFDVEFRV